MARLEYLEVHYALISLAALVLTFLMGYWQGRMARKSDKDIKYSWDCGVCQMRFNIKTFDVDAINQARREHLSQHGIVPSSGGSGS